MYVEKSILSPQIFLSIVDHFYCNVIRNLDLSYSVLLISIVD